MSGKKFVAFFEDKFDFLRLPERGMTTDSPNSRKARFGLLTFKCSLESVKSAGFNPDFVDFAEHADNPDDIRITFNCNWSGDFTGVWLTGLFNGEPKQKFTDKKYLFYPDYPETSASRLNLFEVQSSLAAAWKSRKEFYVPRWEPKAEPGEFETYKEAAEWAKEWKRKHPGKECPVHCDFGWNVWVKSAKSFEQAEKFFPSSFDPLHSEDNRLFSNIKDLHIKIEKIGQSFGRRAFLIRDGHAKRLAEKFPKEGLEFFQDLKGKFGSEIPRETFAPAENPNRLWAVARKTGGKDGPKIREAVWLCFSEEAARVHSEWREARNGQEWENYNKDKKGKRGNEPEDPEESEFEVFELSGKSLAARRLVAEGKWNSESAELRREAEKKIVAPFVSELKSSSKEICESAVLSAEEKAAAVHKLIESELEKISLSETEGRKFFEKKAMKASAEAFEEIEGGLVSVLAERVSSAMKSLNAKRTSETVLAFAKAGLEGFSKPEKAMLNAALGRKGVSDEKSLSAVLKKEIAKIEKRPQKQKSLKTLGLSLGEYDYGR